MTPSSLRLSLAGGGGGYVAPVDLVPRTGSGARLEDAPWETQRDQVVCACVGDVIQEKVQVPSSRCLAGCSDSCSLHSESQEENLQAIVE